MSQVAIVGDLHFAPKCENATIKDNVVKGQHAFLDWMVDDLKARNVKQIVFLGDVFSNRQFIAVGALDYAISFFKDKLADFEVFVISGNHDLMYENSSSVTSIRMLSLLPNVHLFAGTVGKHEILGKTWYFVPWVIPDSAEKVSSWLVKLGCRMQSDIEKTVIAGHFEMVGALMEAGQISSGGFEPKKFLDAAKFTFSGHYHCRSEITGKSGNDHKIVYTGSPYHLSFAHVGTDCGYYLLDDKDNITFVENTVSPRFIECVDTELDNLPDMTNSFVRYYVRNDRSFDEASELKGKVLDCNPIVIKSIPYGGEDTATVEEAREQDNEEARRIMSSDSISMASIYMEKHPEILPTLHSGENPAEKILSFLREFDSNP
ncbi:MAG: metallophosphoesterase [Fibrobacter sp.]|nr:metallophosphoesterase [Fibrobacter sp.]